MINLKLTVILTNIKDLHMGVSDFKKGYQSRNNTVKDVKGDLVTGCHSILAVWMNHSSQLLNVYVLNVVRQREIHAAERLVPEPRAFEVEMAIEKIQSHKSPGNDQIPTELRQG